MEVINILLLSLMIIVGELGSIFEKFKEFKVYMEKQSGQSLKIFRTDGGREYTSNEFSVFCKNHGIKHQLTASYSLQQNGVIERKNRTICEMARKKLAQNILGRSCVLCYLYFEQVSYKECSGYDT